MVMLVRVFKASRLVQLAHLGSCRQGVAETAGQVLLATCWAELSSRERHPSYSSGTRGNSLQEGDSKEGVLGHCLWQSKHASDTAEGGDAPTVSTGYSLATRTSRGLQWLHHAGIAHAL